MSKDTAKQPVDSLEDDISKAIDQAEEISDETEKQDTETERESENVDSKGEGLDEGAETEVSMGDGDESSDNSTDEDSGKTVEAGTESDDSGETDEDDLADSEGEKPDLIDPPQHWAAADKELFSNQTREAQEWLLERHKSMEGDYTRKSQEIADTQRRYDAIKDALAPFEQEFARAGLDQAGAVRKLASVHQALKTDGKSAILALAQTYGIDLAEEDQTVDPTIRKTQSQLSAIEQRIARQERAAQQEKQQALIGQIQAFEQAKDESGKLKHPHFQSLQADITALFNAKLANTLEEGYSKALSMRPDLRTSEPVIKTPNRAEKVKKAKKAATGIKSSGAVGKRERALTLEEEIASQIP